LSILKCLLVPFLPWDFFPSRKSKGKKVLKAKKASQVGQRMAKENTCFPDAPSGVTISLK